MIHEQLSKLAATHEDVCLTISFNTHRTHPDNVNDIVALKNLCHEAEKKLINEHGKRKIQPLLDQLEKLPSEIDVNYNLDSLHIFLSNDIKEIIRSPWPVSGHLIHTGPTFNLRALIKMMNRTTEYLIMVLSKSGVHLYTAVNDVITGEIRNGDFPFKENRHYVTFGDKGSEPKLADNLIREYINPIDKALVKVHHETGMSCVVVCTEENHNFLMQVADQPSVYTGFVNINYNDVSSHKIAEDAWSLIQEIQHQLRTSAISEMEEAVGQGRVLTDIIEIINAAKEGRGELLITHNDFQQPVVMTGDNRFELTGDLSAPGVIEDVTGDIAWEVISKKGRAVFTSQDEIKKLGNIALKIRY